jgi:predicted nicotinamide N-methyase
MASPSPARLRAFVRGHTRLQPVPDIPGVRLYTADDVMTVMHLAGRELGQADPSLPFWAFPWAGGLAVARYLVEHPEEVAGKHVLDLASGSGLCAIVAMRMGAASVQGIDIDPFAEAATALNAQANGVRIGFSRHDILDDPPPAADVILAGDVCYEETMADRMLGWLRQAARNGTRVLIGDPGRAYLPADLSLLATYRVTTSRELEDAEVKPSAVYTLPTPQ